MGRIVRSYAREALDPLLPAAGGLFDRRPRICPAHGARDRKPGGIHADGLHVRWSGFRVR